MTRKYTSEVCPLVGLSDPVVKRCASNLSWHGWLGKSPQVVMFHEFFLALCPFFPIPIRNIPFLIRDPYLSGSFPFNPHVQSVSQMIFWILTKPDPKMVKIHKHHPTFF
jgi:hypothetical protein